MRYGDRNNNLGKYILISIIIHLLLIFFFPFGALRGMADEGGSGNRDFGFIQFVEIQSTERETSPESEEQSIKKEEIEQESTEKNEKELEKPKEEPIEKLEEKINIDEENQKQQTEEEKIKDIETAEKEVKNTENQNVLTSEKSDLEIANNEQSPADPEDKNEKTNNGNGEEKSQEEPPPPPPPPTAGELIGLSPRPVYPKYLVSEQKTGNVKLNVHVSKQGEIEEIEIIDSSGIETMDRNAVLTIENGWEFQNYQQPYTISVIIDYKIDNNGNTKVDIELQNVNFK